MKSFNHQTISGLAVAAMLFFIPSASRAVETNLVSSATNSVAPAKPKPDLLKTCPVADEKLGGDMGKPYTFVYKDQEVKLCCSMCKADFDKDPAKYLKKIREADKKAADKN